MMNRLVILKLLPVQISILSSDFCSVWDSLCKKSGSKCTNLSILQTRLKIKQKLKLILILILGPTIPHTDIESYSKSFKNTTLVSSIESTL